MSAWTASISVAIETIGTISAQLLALGGAQEGARTWVRNRAGRSSDMRMARQPSAGFSSLSWRR